MKKLLIPLIAFTLLGSFSLVSFAQPAGNTGAVPVVGEVGPVPVQTESASPVGFSAKINNPFNGGVDSLTGLLKLIIDEIVLPVGASLAVLAFIYAGFKYVTAQGDTTKIKEAHNALWFTAIGTAVLLGSWLFSQVIYNTIKAISAP